MALVALLRMVEQGAVELVTSSVLPNENERNPFPRRRQWVQQCMRLAAHHQVMDEAIRLRALVLEGAGLKAADALHVAAAEAAGCAFLLTCDDRLKAKSDAARLRLLNPVDYVLMSTTGEGNGGQN